MDMINFRKNFKKKLIKKVNDLRLKRYYYEKTGEGKTYLAMILDKVIFKIILFSFLIMFFYYISKSFWFSLIISIQIFILYNFVAYKTNKLKYRKIIRTVNRQVVLRKFFKELLNYSPHDYIDYIVEILEKYGVENIEKLERRDIDIICTLSGEKIGVKCFQYDNDYKVGVDIIRDFYIGLRKLHINKGVIITTSSFTQETIILSEKLKKHLHIQLVGIEEIIDIIDKAKIYPSDSEIKNIILNEISDNKIHFNTYKDVILSKNKILKYILLGVSMIIFGNFTPYKLYYIVVGYIIFGIALLSIIKLLNDLFKANEERYEDKLL